jgi:hypothetical protein
MATALTSAETRDDVEADAQALTHHLATGQPLPDDVSRRIEERAQRAREDILRTRGTQEIGVQLIREARGPVDDDAAASLTLAQRDLLRTGRLRMKDPDTGVTYVLVPEDEYNRIRKPA